MYAAVLAVCATALIGLTTVSAATLPSTADDIVILASSGMTLGVGTGLTSGQAVVNDQNGVAIIRPGFNGVASGTELVADNVIVRSGVSKPEFFDLFTNNLNPGRGVIIQDQGPSSIMSFPVIANPPALPNPFPSPGTDRCPAPGRIAGDCIVRFSNGPVTIQPGNYRKIEVRFGATLYFAGGTYNVKSIHASANSHILFNGTTTINVTNNASFEPRVEVVPAFLTQPNPRCIRFNVAGKRIFFLPFSKISGVFVAPAAHIVFGSFGVFEGNFEAQTVTAYSDTTFIDPPAMSGSCL